MADPNWCALMVCPGLLEWVKEIILPAGALGAATFAAVFAWKRYRVADDVLRHDQFRQAANLLADRESHVRNRYLDRTASAAMLASIAKKAPDDYHVVVMRVFEAYLHYSPSQYSGFEGLRGPVDPDSSDTAEIIRFIEQRDTKQKDAETAADYRFDLAPPSPFRMENGRFFLRDASLTQVREWCQRRNIESRFLNNRHPQAMRWAHGSNASYAFLLVPFLIVRHADGP